MKTRLTEYVSKLPHQCRLGLEEIIERDTEIVIPSEEKVSNITSLFKVLGNPVRIKILYLLSQTSLPVCLLSAIIGVDQTLVSHHLSILKKYGLVESSIVGKFRVYRIRDNNVLDILKKLLQNVGK